MNSNYKVSWGDEMMKKNLILVVFLFLISCMQVKEDANLYHEYETYVNLIEGNQTLFVDSMVTEEVKEKIKFSGLDQFPILTGFPGVLSDVKSHYQLIKSGEGCLTVNGYDENRKPVSLYIEYLYQNRQWLLSFIEVYYLSTPGEFENVGVCPTKL